MSTSKVDLISQTPIISDFANAVPGRFRIHEQLALLRRRKTCLLTRNHSEQADRRATIAFSGYVSTRPPNVTSAHLGDLSAWYRAHGRLAFGSEHLQTVVARRPPPFAFGAGGGSVARYHDRCRGVAILSRLSRSTCLDQGGISNSATFDVVGLVALRIVNIAVHDSWEGRAAESNAIIGLAVCRTFQMAPA